MAEIIQVQYWWNFLAVLLEIGFHPIIILLELVCLDHLCQVQETFSASSLWVVSQIYFESMVIIVLKVISRYES